MTIPNLFYSFRARLLFLLAVLLVATLGVQYYLNREAEGRFAQVLAEQEQALSAGFALAVESLSSTVYLADLQKQSGDPLLERQAGRVINILVVDEKGQIDDSLDPKYQPQSKENGTTQYFNISNVPLPKLVNAGQPLGDIRQMLPAPPVSAQPRTGEPRAFLFPIVVVNEQNEKTMNYIIVVLGSANPTAGESLSRSLWPTLIVLLVATLIASLSLWRFTRPIKDLSEAARRVAAGDFDFRVPAAERRDEMGVLAANFNEMTTRLIHTRELETRLNQAERSAVVGRLASAIAHEIRNPLNYINLTLDHMRTMLAPEDDTKRQLFARLTEQLKKEVARINTRITEFLKYTRPAKLDIQPLDLRATITDALSIVEVQAAESGIETRVEQSGALPTVAGDAESLRSVFTNLIINGMQAMESGAGGRLTIRLSNGQGHARVEIADTGRGIAPENISQIFEPYFSTKETGTGLGLAIVKKAVEDHGGAISVRSAPGEGTTFTVELPTTGGSDG
ncbi:MAG: ATP-binding protein [Acidobacteriota bacterium]|nr:ATP-binding protein [Acidobacteriota bacterium]